MVPVYPGSDVRGAMRLKDFQYFSSSTPMISYQNRKGNLLEFMADYIHVQIEVKKPGVIEYAGMQFDDVNYEVIEVPINDIEKR